MLIAGFEVLGQRDEAGGWHDVTVFVGPGNAPGWRLKDGHLAAIARRRIRSLVADALGIPLADVAAQARYSETCKGKDSFHAAEEEAWTWAEEEDQRRRAAP